MNRKKGKMHFFSLHLLTRVKATRLALVGTHLATDGTGDGLAGVDIGEESRGLVLDLLDVETLAGVDTVVDNAGLEGTLKAADSVDVAILTHGVGESDTVESGGVSNAFSFLLIQGKGLVQGTGEANLPRGAGHATLALVNVGSSVGGGLKVTTEAINGDVVADDILVRVDAVKEPASGALKAASELVLAVDDLVGGGLDSVCGGVVEGDSRHVRLGLVLGAADDAVDLAVEKRAGGGQGGKGEGSNSGLHVGGV